MKTEKLSKRQKLPAIWWHSIKKQFVCKIGYKRVKREPGWRRVKSFQTLGKSEADAMQRALALQADWQWTLEFFKTSTPHQGDEPYWLPEGHIDLYRAADAGNWDVIYNSNVFLKLADFEDEEDYQLQAEQLANHHRNRITLGEAKELFLANYRNRIGLAGGKGINAYTFKHYEINLKQVFRYIDSELPLKDLTRSDLETVVNRFMQLPNGIAIRTAVNYCKSFKQMLDWLADEESVNFVKPRGMDRLFRFRNYNPIRIEPYSNQELKAICDAMPGKCRLYPQLAINCGYYQIDIATLAYKHLVTFKDGEEVAVDDLSNLTGDLFIRRHRRKTLHQNNFQTLCYVWPESAQLLKKYAAPANNPHGLVLLNELGLPLVRNKTNLITDRFTQYKKQLNLNRRLEFKQFRKTGATWMERHHGDRVARMYNAHSLSGELKRYVAQDFEPLTVALKDWAGELRQAKVLI